MRSRGRRRCCFRSRRGRGRSLGWSGRWLRVEDGRHEVDGTCSIPRCPHDQIVRSVAVHVPNVGESRGEAIRAGDFIAREIRAGASVHAASISNAPLVRQEVDSEKLLRSLIVSVRANSHFVASISIEIPNRNNCRAKIGRIVTELAQEDEPADAPVRIEEPQHHFTNHFTTVCVTLVDKSDEQIRDSVTINVRGSQRVPNIIRLTVSIRHIWSFDSLGPEEVSAGHNVDQPYFAVARWQVTLGSTNGDFHVAVVVYVPQQGDCRAKSERRRGTELVLGIQFVRNGDRAFRRELDREHAPITVSLRAHCNTDQSIPVEVPEEGK